MIHRQSSGIHKVIKKMSCYRSCNFKKGFLIDKCSVFFDLSEKRLKLRLGFEKISSNIAHLILVIFTNFKSLQECTHSWSDGVVPSKKVWR